MTAMEGNPHYDEAQSQSIHADTDVSANWATNTGEYKSDMLAAAQIEATLALAFEQRTANLIALYSMDDDARQGMIDGAGMHSEHWVDVTRQIAERLGLK